jgi:hypothetical protein
MTVGPNNAIEVVNEGSHLVQLSRDAAWPMNRPAQTGTVGSPLGAVPALANGDTFNVTYDATTTLVTLRITTALTRLQDVRMVLQTAIREANRDDLVLAGATVQLIDDGFRILAGQAGTNVDPATTLTLSESVGTTAAALGLNVAPNVQQYAPSAGPRVGAQGSGVLGVDGDPPDATALRGIRDPDKSGLYALEDVDIFNLVCLPRAAELDPTAMAAVLSEVQAYLSRAACVSAGGSPRGCQYSSGSHRLARPERHITPPECRALFPTATAR